MIANSARRTLIQLGKVLPFAICIIVILSYIETLYALVQDDYIHYHDCDVLNTPISFYFAKNIFEYDFFIIIVLFVTSIAIEACVYNRLAILFLAIHLLLKPQIECMEVSTTFAIIYSILTILFLLFCVLNGARLIFHEK